MTVSAFESDQHPLRGIKLGRLPRARDPNLCASAGAAPQPPPAPLTTDNNRITMRVPAHATKLSLGQGDAKETATRNKRAGVGTEHGIVGQTDEHIHWETFGTTDLTAKTLVRLGTPPTSVPPNGYQPGAFTGIGCMFHEAYGKWNGYSMVTQGAAYQEARENHIVSSATGEVRVVAKKLISIGSAGNVIIGADSGASPEELVKNQGGPDDLSAFGQPDSYFRMQKLARLGSKLAEFPQVALAMIGTIAAYFGSFNTEPVDGATGWEEGSWTELAEMLLTAAELDAKWASWSSGLVLPPSTRGDVGVYADKGVTLGAAETVAINAGAAASMVAGFAAGITAPLTSIVGLISAGLSGVLASVSGLWSATVEGTFGYATLRSPRGVQAYSALGRAKVTGLQSVQLNSIASGAYVHGMTSAYIGSGPVLGWGLRATPLKVQIGQMAAAGVFAYPGFIPAMGINIDDAGISLQCISSTVKVNETGVLTVGAAEVSTAAPVINVLGDIEVTIDAPVVNVSGGRVNLG